MKTYFIYIVSNTRRTVFYTGITSDLVRRIHEHKNKLIPGFTHRYNITDLLYYEAFTTPTDAIAAEKKIKGWIRERKLALIKTLNPTMLDLAESNGILRFAQDDKLSS